MDRTEYELKLDQINELVEDEDYEGALEIVDSIDWRRVKSVRTLCRVADIYEVNELFGESKRILLMAYKRSSVGKIILYRLIELSLKTGQIDEAVEYYTEFLQIAPGDHSKYILQYQIYRAKGTAIKDQIDILKEYKSKEHTERWGYELARLYQKAGMEKECVQECDELILWFSEGYYVTKAMELKMQYEPLTPSQQEKYDNREIYEEEEDLEPGTPENIQDSKNQAVLQKLETAADELPQIADPDEIELPQIEVEPEQTIPPIEPEKLKEKLATSFKDVFSGFTRGKEEVQKEIASREEEYGEDNDLSDVDYGAVKELEPENFQETTILHGSDLTKIGNESSELESDESVPELEEVSEALDESVSELEEVSEVPEESVSELEEDSKAQEDSVTEEMIILEAAAEEAEAEEEASEVEEIPDPEEAAEVEKETSETEESPEAEESEDPELEVIPETEETETLEETSETEEEAQGTEEIPEVTAQKFPGMEEETSEETYETEEASEIEENTEEEEIETEKEAAESAEEEASEVEEISDPEEVAEAERETSETEESPESEEPETLEEPAETEEHPTPGVQRIVKLSEEQKKQFSYFAMIPGMEQQILEAMNGVIEHIGDKTSKGGNIAVMGSGGSGKSRLMSGLVVSISQSLGHKSAKMAKISGSLLNDKDPAEVVDKMAGGFLIIEKASLMSRETVEKLSKALNFRTDGMVLLIEEEKDGMRTMFRAYPDFADKFATVISIPVFTNDELVTFAKTYARESGYRIDGMAVLALYTRIGEQQTEAEPMTVGLVKEIVDKAILKAHRGKLERRVSGKRIDQDGFITLYEKDFNF